MDPVADGLTQPSSGDTEAPQGTPELGASPAPSAPAGLAQTPGVELGGQEPVAPSHPEVETLNKRLSDAQDKIRAQGEELAALRQSFQSPRAPQFNQQPPPPAPAPMYAPPGYDEQYLDPNQQYAGLPQEQQLQVRPVEHLILQDQAVRIHQLEVQTRLPAAEEAVGFQFNPSDREHLLKYMETTGSSDPVACARHLFFDRALKAAEDKGKKATIQQVQKGQAAAAPAPAGRPGEPKRDVTGLSPLETFETVALDALRSQQL